MATNTKRDENGRLVIKYAPTSVYNPAIRTKLIGSVELARRSASIACEQLRWLAVKSHVSPSDIGEVPYRTLRRHFALPALPAAGVIPDLAWAAWAKSIDTIAFNLLRISQGLEQQITIADGQATNEKKYRAIGVTMLTTPTANPAVVNAAAEEWARGKAMAKSGFVAVKSEAAATMGPDALSRYLKGDLSVRVDTADKGSIHVNFRTQLADNTVTNVRVAATIIHEASHKFCDTRDFAYSEDPAYRSLTLANALMNADSYAFTAICLYKKCFFADEGALRKPPAGVNMWA